MPTRYRVILTENFNWGGEESKEKVINKIVTELKEKENIRVEVEEAPYSFIVLSWDRLPINEEKYKHYVLNYCDRAFYYADYSMELMDITYSTSTTSEQMLQKLCEDIKYVENQYYPDFLKHIDISDLIDIHNKRIKKEDL